MPGGGKNAIRRRNGGLPLGSFAAWYVPLNVMPVGAPGRAVVKDWSTVSRGPLAGCAAAGAVQHSASAARTLHRTSMRPPIPLLFFSVGRPAQPPRRVLVLLGGGPRRVGAARGRAAVGVGLAERVGGARRPAARALRRRGIVVGRAGLRAAGPLGRGRVVARGRRRLVTVRCSGLGAARALLRRCRVLGGRSR